MGVQERCSQVRPLVRDCVSLFTTLGARAGLTKCADLRAPPLGGRGGLAKGLSSAILALPSNKIEFLHKRHFCLQTRTNQQSGETTGSVHHVAWQP